LMILLANQEHFDFDLWHNPLPTEGGATVL